MPEISDQEIKDNMDKAASLPVMTDVHYGIERPDEACFILRDGTLVTGGAAFWYQKNTVGVLQLMLGQYASDDWQSMVRSAGLVVIVPGEGKYLVYDDPTERQERVLMELQEFFGFDLG